MASTLKADPLDRFVFTAWLIVSLAALAAASPAQADVFQAGEFHIQRTADGNQYRLIARLPAGSSGDAELLLPADCTPTARQLQTAAQWERLQLDFNCSRPLDRNDRISTPWKLDAARVVSTLGETAARLTLPRSAGGMTIPLAFGLPEDRSVAELVPMFLWQGMLHIWVGWDHLAFVLCLCLLVRGMPLLGLITAFTLGHSLSLGLAFFEIVRIPISPVETIIALSIVLVAREALLPSQREASERRTSYRETIVIVIFGLIHGLGFASALGELGVSMAERWPALISFNLGVEIGQLVFVAAVLLFRSLGTSRSALPARSALLYGAGSLAMFWAVERVAGFPWP